MARRMVAVPWRAWPRAASLSLLLSAVCACSAFHPVGERRFTLLNDDNFERLEMLGAHWRAYDDQHSHTSPCTNGAAGNHDPEQCSSVDRPEFGWNGGKCKPTPEQLSKGDIDPEPSGSICVQGVLGKVLSCKTSLEQCYHADGDEDVSNMWGAGVGLAFSEDGAALGRSWPRGHGVALGVANADAD